MNRTKELNSFSRFLHHVRNRIAGFAQKPYATLILFIMAFVESSLFPLAPDFLFIPLSVLYPRRSLRYAAICVIGSTLGAIAGYYIGFGLFELLGEKILSLFGWAELFQTVLIKYRTNVWGALLLAGFTPIPFQVFALAAGFKQTIDIGTFALATLVGRSLRFFLVGVLLFLFGANVKVLLDTYLEWVAIALFVLLVIWIFGVVI